MSKASGMLRRTAIVVGIAGLTALAAWAATAVNVTASLATSCSNCATDVAGKYSLLQDEFGAYSPFSDGRIQSQILTNNSVYTLDTTATLSNGLVGPSTRTVFMHFYSSVECGVTDPTCKYPNNVLPPCWGGQYDQDQAVNWSVFAPTSFLRMTTGGKYSAMARLNFNVRNAACDGQINRFRLEWGTACITRTATNRWEVTSRACTSSTINWGEAHLEAYGGTKKNTVDYGDWRMPFSLTLARP